MGKSKALIIASAMALISGTGAVWAADLLPPPPPAPIPVAEPEFGGWYLRADVGIGLNDLRLRQSYDDGGLFHPGNIENDVRTDQKSLEDSTFLRAGIGYQFNPWFRADVTGEYRTSSAFNAIESFRNTDFAGNGFGSCGVAPVTFVSANVVTQTGAANPIQRCYDKYTASVRSAVVLANGYIDLGTWYNLTPYVGAGIGVANNRITSLTDFGNNGGAGIAANNSKWSPAWALMAGVAYSVTPNLKLEAGYRYLDLGSINSKPIVCNDLSPGSCHFEVQRLKLTSNDFHIGMRWLLSANSYGNGQALYWGQGGAASGTLAGGGYAGGGGYAAAGAGYEPSGRPLVKRY